MNYILESEYEVEKAVLIHCLTPARLFKMNVEERKTALDKVAIKIADSEFDIYHSKIHFCYSQVFLLDWKNRKSYSIITSIN